MNPQTQLTPNACLQACIATLLEIPIGKVPNFADAPEVEGSPFPGFWLSLQTWLSQKGLFLLEMQLPPNMPFMPLPHPVLCIFFGETKRGVKHAIVGRIEGDQFIQVHNPLPEAEFAGGVGGLGFIVPRDPHLVIGFGKALDKILKLTKGIVSSNEIGNAIREEAAKALGHQVNGVEILRS